MTLSFVHNYISRLKCRTKVNHKIASNCNSSNKATNNQAKIKAMKASRNLRK